MSFQTLPNFCQPHFQSYVILLHPNNILTILAALYSLSRHNFNIQNCIDYFGTISQNFVIGGDYNAKHFIWSCRSNNPRSMILYNFIDLKAIQFSPPSPPTRTHILVHLSTQKTEHTGHLCIQHTSQPILRNYQYLRTVLGLLCSSPDRQRLSTNSAFLTQTFSPFDW